MTDVNPVAVVGLAAIMPMAPDGDAFWANITGGRYCITEVTPDRWDSALYYSPDHSARDKTYSIIGGWVREFEWDPIRWRLPIPPTVAAQMDEGQRWALSAARRALMDAGWPNWSIDSERVAVILGNAIGGEKHYKSSMRIQLPEALKRLEESATLRSLSPEAQRAIIEETRAGYLDNMFEITEDTMPGELSNVIAGRIANVLNLRGPNYTTDAACASGLAALNSAILGLNDHQYDAVITGGIDRNMGVDAFVKFCKIGALSATGTRPFDAGADGFVMGEGAALFVLKRLEDAERDGDKIYSVILSVGGSSDGKGKGITAPNPVGQKLAVARAWERAGVDPSTASAIEAHGTSTSVGDATELESLTAIFGAAGAKPGSIALGLGEVQHRPPQGLGRHGWPVQDGEVAAREGPRALAQLRQPQPQCGLGHRPLRGQHHAAPLADARGRHPPRWRERLRFRRHQLPRRRRGARPRTPQAPPQGVCRR